MARPIESLSPAEVLVTAIALETLNAERYQEWALRMKTWDTKAVLVLEELAAEEEAHRAHLVDMYRRQFGREPPPVDPQTARPYADAQALPEDHFFVVGVGMARQVLETALKVEIASREFYERALANTTDPDLQALFKPLVDFEDDHVRVLVKRLEALG